MNYVFKTTPAFRRALAKLSPGQKSSARTTFAWFRMDPFDPRLRTHKIIRLSAIYKKTIYAVRVENDLRAVFYLEGNTVISVDIGTHAIYRG